MRQHIKKRDITLPIKVHLVKAMVFPVVMYGCESWTMNKAEHRRIDAFELWFLYSPTLTSVHDYWINHSFDDTDFCLQNDGSAF